jgi:hypothetical protein
VQIKDDPSKGERIMNIYDYIDQAVKSFEIDPSDTDYQRGYEAAVNDTWTFLNEEKVNNNEPA